MAWETRKRGGSYYTRSRRQNGRVIREYIGCGRAARVIADADHALIAEREATLIQVRAAEEHFRSLEQPLDALDAICNALVRLDLKTAGYHQHHRGEWRKRRVPTE